MTNDRLPKILDTALKMLNAGFNIIPADHKTKRPIGAWKKYQNRKITPEELKEQYKKKSFKAISVVCGKTSGKTEQDGLCIIDFDVQGYYEKWVEAVGPDVAKSFPTVLTGGGGHHVYVRCPEPGKNQQLAFHKNGDKEAGREIAIETRASGGLACAPPSIHPSGHTYEWSKNCAKRCEPINQDQFNILLKKARSLDTAPQSDQQEKVAGKAKHKRRSFDQDGLDIIGKYNQAHTIQETLEAYGYHKSPKHPIMYVRPDGKEPTVNIIDGSSYHHNTSDPLCDGHLHDSFDLFCRFEHNGNMNEAVKAAAQELNIVYIPLMQKKAKLINEGGDELVGKAPFKCLGYDKGYFFYLPNASNQILTASTSGHTKLFLISLAPITWWEKNFMIGRKVVDWDLAANTLFSANYRIGKYDPKKVRGCGAWVDDGRIVVHAGNRLIVDGKEQKIHNFKSNYIYESDIPMRVSLENPLSPQEAQEFMSLLEMLAWSKPIEAKLFGGWLFLASVCGALRWRPHLWVTGPKGIGKSTILNDIGAAIMGNNKLQVQSNTTEAGLRQSLGFSAFPVFFDEIDTQLKRDTERVVRIVELMRQASTESDSGIVKGGMDGKAHEFRIKSMFCLGSVNTQIELAADASRISVLTLIKHPDHIRNEMWEKISRLYPKFTDPVWSERFRARAILMLPTVLKNIEIFINAFSAFYERRAGQQMGTMLAGAYSGFYSDKVVDYEWAKNWIDTQDWTNQSVLDAESDELKCLYTILESTINVSTSDKKLERTIHELVSCIYDGTGRIADEMEVSIEVAQKTINRHGIKYDYDNKILWVSNSNKAVRKMLFNSPWQAKWRDVLVRIDGAIERRAVRFGNMTQRAVGVPLKAFNEDK